MWRESDLTICCPHHHQECGQLCGLCQQRQNWRADQQGVGYLLYSKRKVQKSQENTACLCVLLPGACGGMSVPVHYSILLGG